MRRSGLQRQVLSLYKQLLSKAKTKDAATVEVVRTQFRQDAFSVDRMNIQRIEHLIRRGERQLQALDAIQRVSLR